MRQEDLVSVGMPVYNGARYLREAIASVLGQTHENFELLISDNASTDETEAICREAAASDSRIRYVRQSTNIGAVANFNFVAANREGQYFLWCAHDDLREPSYLEKTVALLRSRPDALAAHSLTVLRDTANPHLAGAEWAAPLGRSSRIGSSGLLERIEEGVRDTFRLAGIYALIRMTAMRSLPPMTSRFGADTELLFRLVVRGPFLIVDEPLFIYRALNTYEHYVGMADPLAGDPILGELPLFEGVVRDEVIDRRLRARALEHLERVLRPRLEARFDFLVGELLRSTEPGGLKRLLTYGRQYPRVRRSRIFWGAARRLAWRAVMPSRP